MEQNEILEIKNQLSELNDRITSLENLFQSKVPTIEKKLSIGEFFLSKNPKDEIQKTLAICYYLEKHNGLGKINSIDVKEAFRQAKEKAPENINYKVFMLIKKGYMMEENEKKDNLKAWTLTNSGERFVENNFQES